MVENVTKLPVKRETMEPSFARTWHPFESLHREIDRLFDDFGSGFRWPFGRSLFGTEPKQQRAPRPQAMTVVILELVGAKMPGSASCGHLLLLKGIIICPSPRY